MWLSTDLRTLWKAGLGSFFFIMDTLLRNVWTFQVLRKALYAAEGLVVEGLVVEGLVVEGLVVEGLVVEGLVSSKVSKHVLSVSMICFLAAGDQISELRLTSDHMKRFLHQLPT